MHPLVRFDNGLDCICGEPFFFFFSSFLFSVSLSVPLDGIANPEVPMSGHWESRLYRTWCVSLCEL